MTGSGRLYPTQERLWRLEQRQPGRRDFLVAGLLRLSGRLDEDALRYAVAALVARHEALRTGFRDTAAGPRCFTVASAPPLLTRFDVRGTASKPPAERARDLVEHHCGAPFDLTAPPLFRAAVARYEETGWLFAMATHHIVTDGCSCGILLGELARLYRSRCTGSPSGLADPAPQYGEFVERQHAWLSGGEARASLAFWLRELEGYRPLRVRPSRRAEPGGGPCGGTYSLMLPLPLCDGVRGTARRLGCTPFMLLLAVLYVTVHLYTGETDIALGSAMANRGRSGYEGVVGYLRTIVVLRETVTGDRSFADLLTGVRSRVLSAYDHQALPFDHIVSALADGSGVDGERLYPDVLCCTDDSASAPWSLPGVSAEPLDRQGVVAKRPLSLFLQDRSGRIALRFVHRPDVLSQDDVRAFGEIFRSLTERVVAGPRTGLDTLIRETDIPAWWLPGVALQEGTVL